MADFERLYGEEKQRRQELEAQLQVLAERHELLRSRVMPLLATIAQVSEPLERIREVFRQAGHPIDAKEPSLGG